MADISLHLHRSRWRVDFFSLVVWTVPLLVAAVFFWILGDILLGGIGQISWSFITDAPIQAGRGGGIGPILV